MRTLLLIGILGWADSAAAGGLSLSQRIRKGDTWVYRMSIAGSVNINLETRGTMAATRRSVAVTSEGPQDGPQAFGLGVEQVSCSLVTIQDLHLPPPPRTEYSQRETSWVELSPPRKVLTLQSASPYLFNAVTTGEGPGDWFAANLDWKGDSLIVTDTLQVLRHAGKAGGHDYYYGWSKVSGMDSRTEEFLWLDSLGVIGLDYYSTRGGPFPSGSRAHFSLESWNGQPLDTLVEAVFLDLAKAHPGSPGSLTRSETAHRCVDPGVSIRKGPVKAHRLGWTGLKGARFLNLLGRSRYPARAGHAAPGWLLQDP